jgi:hypothetical protein
MLATTSNSVARAVAALSGTACILGAQITVQAGEDLQRAINSSPQGSELVLAAGEHSGERIRLRSGDVLRGEPGAKLIGSLELRGVTDVEIRALHIETAAGDCIRVRDAAGVRIRASDIGPCAGNGVYVQQSEQVLVTDNYIHPEHYVVRCCDTGDGLYAVDVSRIRIAGNVIAFGETNVELHGVDGAEVVGNYLLNPLGPYPRGQHVQAYFGSRDVTIEGNYLQSSKDRGYPFPERQEDAINAGQSDGISVTGNFITGGGSASGCGIIADQGAHAMSIVDNTLWLTGQCGIGIASGTGHTIIGNKVRNWFLEDPGAGNTAIYVWRQYSGACGPVHISGNIAYARKPWGEASSFWKGSSACDPVTVVQNVFGDQARQALPDGLLESMRPAIPPRPQNCVAPAPYVNARDKPACEAAGVDPEGVPPPIRARSRVRRSP